jgi:hypothetical protein
MDSKRPRLEPCGTPFIRLFFSSYFVYEITSKKKGTITGLNFSKWVKSLSLVKDSISTLSVLEWNNLLNITLVSSNFIFFERIGWDLFLKSVSQVTGDSKFNKSFGDFTKIYRCK